MSLFLPNACQMAASFASVMFLSLANAAAGTEPFAVEPVAGIAGQAVPVSVHVPQDLRAADADGPVFVLFRDLPAEISFSAGFRTRLGWLVSVKDLGSLMLISSPGSFGVIEIEAVLYRGRDQDHLSDRWRVDLTEPSPSSAEPTSSTRFDPGANLQRHQDRPSKLALAEVQELLRRADTLLHAGDFESARLIYSALADNGIAQAAILMVRIPAMTTTHSDAWRPPVPIDDDQCGAGAEEHRWMCLLISVFAFQVNPALTAFDSPGFAFDIAA